VADRARRWAAGNPGNRAIRAEAAATLTELVPEALRPGYRVLDAGCGTGWWLRELAARRGGAQGLHGIDRDPERAAAVDVPGADVRHGDLRSLPWPDAQFDAVFLLTVLSSLGDRAAVAAAARELRRVLAPGGAVAVWEPRVPTPNRATRLIRPAELAPAFGDPVATRSVTVLPPLARRVGPRTYRRLARVAVLRTHAVAVYRPT
jgi:ubiquinone/menaquinone biosynthesis C-methylase UbiE